MPVAVSKRILKKIEEEITSPSALSGSTRTDKKWIKKKLTATSAPSASTGNLQIASPKSWWYRTRCRWQFVFHRGSTPQKWHCIREKSVKKSTEIRRKDLKKNLPSRVPGHRALTICHVIRRKSSMLTGAIRVVLWVPPHRALTNVHFEIFHIYIIFEHVFINKLSFRVVCLTGPRKGTWLFDYFSLA